jgi:hypothetical protein
VAVAEVLSALVPVMVAIILAEVVAVAVQAAAADWVVNQATVVNLQSRLSCEIAVVSKSLIPS